MTTPEFTLAMLAIGLITEDEALAALEILECHGSFDANGYTGYDYRNQRWITS